MYSQINPYGVDALKRNEITLRELQIRAGWCYYVQQFWDGRAIKPNEFTKLTISTINPDLLYSEGIYLNSTGDKENE